MRRATCRGCESNKLVQFMDLGMMPLAGGFLCNEEAVADEKLYPLSIYVCEECSLAQVLEVLDPEVLFQDYSFSSSTIGPLVQHFENYAKWLANKLGPQTVVEFGCNDGVLLTPLEKLGIKAVGVDVSRNITEIARSKGLDVITGYFDEEMAEAIHGRLGRVDVVIGTNVFAHNDQPERILKAAQRLVKTTGHLCLEVMYAGDLLEFLQWDTLYHEHLTFYSLSSLQVLLNRYSFHIVDAERIPVHGGSLRVVATPNAHALRQPGVDRVLEYEEAKRLTDPETWLTFGAQAHRKIQVVTETFGHLSRHNRIWAYGAAGKATMWVNACQMTYLEAVVDASPLRAGKLMPGTHTPIVFPEELEKSPPDYIFVTAWNYAEHIRAKESWYQGIWSVPLPELRFF